MTTKNENQDERPGEPDALLDSENIGLILGFLWFWLRGPLIIVLGTALVGASIYLLPKYFEQSKEIKISHDSVANPPEPESERKQLSEFQQVLASENLEELIEYADRKLAYARNLELSEHIRLFQELFQIVDRADEIEAKTSNRLEGQPEILRLNVLSAWDLVVREHGLTEPVENRNLRKCAMELVRSEYPEVARYALFCFVLSLADEIAATQNPDLRAVFETQGYQVAKRYLNDRFKMEQLCAAIKTVAETERDETKQQRLLHLFGDQFMKSQNDLVRQLGRELHDIALKGRLDIDDFLFNVTFGDQEAVAGAINVVAEFDIRSKYGEEIVFRGIQLAESLERLGQCDECNRLIGQLEQAFIHQGDPVNPAVGKYLADYDLRSQLVGKPLDLTANAFDGSTVDYTDWEGKAVVVILLTELDERSLYLMDEVFKLKGYMPDKLAFLCPIFGPDPAVARPEISEDSQAEVFEKLRTRFTHVNFVDGTSMPKLLEQCPILTAPYVLVLNPDREVVAKNCAINSIPGIIESSNWWDQ